MRFESKERGNEYDVMRRLDGRTVARVSFCFARCKASQLGFNHGRDCDIFSHFFLLFFVFSFYPIFQDL